MNEKYKRASFSFGLGVSFIVAGILFYNFYSDLIIRIPSALAVFIGFYGVGLEFEKINMRGPYKLSFGFYFLIFAYWSFEYFNWLFILGISISSGIFFSALAEYLIMLSKNNSKTKKNSKFEGILSVIGSLSSIIGFIIALMMLS